MHWGLRASPLGDRFIIPKLHVHSYKEAKEDPWFLLRNIQMRFSLLVYSQCNATWFCYIGKLFLEEHAMMLSRDLHDEL